MTRAISARECEDVEAEMANAVTNLDDVIGDIVGRIVSIARPRLIVLFGSAARGELGPNSDLDFLVVVDEPAHRRHVAQAIYRNLIGVGFAADIVVVTTDDVRRYRTNPNLVIQPALDEGRVLYAA